MAKPKKDNSSGGGPGIQNNSGSAPVVIQCTFKSCKTKPRQFGFCEEHFTQYKFGLINKKGEHVPDYEKKFGHYKEFIARNSARKVA
jgi:hypothetical protein